MFNNKLSKQPFSIAQLILNLLFATYFLTIQTIELSLSIYVLQENKFDLFNGYLLFKRQAPIWKWWQLVTFIIVILSVMIITRDVLQTLTRKATFLRNLSDMIKFLQILTSLYLRFMYMSPLEKKIFQTNSKEILRELIFLQWIVFLLNIVGWFIPIVRYQEWKKNKYEDIHVKKKT